MTNTPQDTTEQTYIAGQEVIVDGERAIVIEQSEVHGWVNCAFPHRTRFASGGWVTPQQIEAGER